MRKRNINSAIDEKEQLRAGLIFRQPDLFVSISKNVDQIVSVIHSYIPRKNYEVIRSGLNLIYSIVFKYIEIRQGTFFPSMPFAIPAAQEVDLSHDPFLNDILEKMAALQRVAIKDRDLELIKSINDCFAKIATKCIDIRYRVDTTDEHHHCMLVLQYMKQLIEDGLNADLLDVGIPGSLNMRNIGIYLMAKNDSTGVRMVVDNLEKISLYGVFKQNASFLISYPLQAYSVFIRAWVFSRKYYDEFLPQTIFKKVQSIADAYINFKELVPNPISLELQYSLGTFLDLSNKVAMPYVFAEAYNKIIKKELSQEANNSIIERIMDLGHEVWHLYDGLAKSAAKKESFLIHFIDANSHHIAMTLTYFYTLENLSPEQKEKILENIRWVISNYWRLYHYHDRITRSYEMQMFDNLLQLGDRFNDLSLIREIGSLVDIFVSIAGSFLHKQKDGYGFDPIRILERACYLCILSDSLEIKNKFIALVNKSFWGEYVKTYPQHRKLLFRELLEIDPERLRREGRHITFEPRLLAKLDKNKIQLFVSYLKENLKEQNDKS